MKGHAVEIPIHIHIHIYDHREPPPPPVSLTPVLTALADLKELLKMSVASLTAALDGINDVTNELSVVAGKIVVNEDRQLVLIQALKDQIAAGSPITPEQLAQLETSANARKAALVVLRDTLLPIAADIDAPVPEVPPIEDPNL